MKQTQKHDLPLKWSDNQYKMIQAICNRMQHIWKSSVWLSWFMQEKSLCVWNSRNTCGQILHFMSLCWDLCIKQDVVIQQLHIWTLRRCQTLQI